MNPISPAILIVDDAKFSHRVISRLLNQAGYEDIRSADSADEALKQLSERPADVLMADWRMPVMDGLELATEVRRLDQDQHHFTYIMMLTAVSGQQAMDTAFQRGVDEFINKADLANELIPRTLAAVRISTRQNQSLEHQQHLMGSLRQQQRLKQGQLDPITGLGNGQQLLDQLHRLGTHIAHRNGVMSMLSLRLLDSQSLLDSLGEATYRKLLQTVARQIEAQVRPLDVAVRLNQNVFAIAMLNDNDEPPNGDSFERLLKALERVPYSLGLDQGPLQVSGSLVQVLSRDGQYQARDLIQKGWDMVQKNTEHLRIECWNPTLQRQQLFQFNH